MGVVITVLASGILVYSEIFFEKIFFELFEIFEKTENVGFASFGIWWGPTLGFWATIGGFLKVWKLIDQDTPSLGPETRS